MGLWLRLLQCPSFEETAEPIITIVGGIKGHPITVQVPGNMATKKGNICG